MTDPKTLWTQQPAKGTYMSEDVLRQHANHFEKRIRQRNLIEYIAGVIVALVFAGYALFFPDPMLKVGSVMIVAGVLYVMWQLHRRAGPSKTNPAEPTLAFHRAELLRQQQALEGIWFWYLGPMAPGLLVFIVGPALAEPPPSGLMVGVRVGVLSVVFSAVWWINWRAARALRREIARLDAVAR